MALLDEMVKQVEQPGKKIIEEEIKDFSKEIRKYASAFKEVIQKDLEALEILQSLLQRQKETVQAIQRAAGDPKSTYEWRTQIQNRHAMTRKDYYREIMTAALKFQGQLNNLLNQEVQLVYVYQDENNNPSLYTIDENTLTSVLSYEKDKNGHIVGRFIQKMSFLEKVKQKKNLIENQMSENFKLDYFNYTYKQVIWRFNYGHRRESNLIMWLNPDFNSNGRQSKWLKAEVNKQGDIKEAYASIVLDRQINSQKLFNDEKLDNNVHSFMQEVAKVDSESGLLKGDVTVGQIQYAIKGVQASTLGLTQIIKLASSILEKSDGSYLKEDLERQKEEYHKKAGTRNHIQNMSRKAFRRWNRELGKAIEAKNSTSMNILVKYEPSDLSLFGE